MRFEFYSDRLDSVPKLSVDGTVPNSIHFSHWSGNLTPREVKADTSTEIALNLVASANREQLTQGIELVTNNHFDTDGVLSVWTVLNVEKALPLREKLITAAEVGDFSEFPNEEAVKVSIVIQGTEQASAGHDEGSPLARHLAGRTVTDEAEAYSLVLPKVEHLLTHIDEYEPLWRDGYGSVRAAVESFERGASNVTEFKQAGFSLVKLAPSAFGDSGFDPVLHVIPYTAISRYAHGQLFLIATESKGGWYYQIDYPYYSWAETVVRPRIPRRDLESLLSRLNELEDRIEVQWRNDESEMTSAVKVFDSSGSPALSRLDPDQVSKVFEEVADEAVVARV